MRVEHKRPTITQQRMAAAVPPIPKNNKGLFKSIRKKLLSPFTPKQADDNLSYIEEHNDSYSDSEFSEEEEAFEEARAAFLVKGKSLPNPQGPIRNLIGDSTNWRPDDWSTVAGRSIPRTPINQQKLYPELPTVQESNEPPTGEVEFEKPSTSQPVQRNCYGQVKGQPPTRVSERNRNKITQPQPTTSSAEPIEPHIPTEQVDTITPLQPEGPETDPTRIDDIYLDLITPSGQEEEIDDFSSVTSHTESLHHSQLVKLALEVEQQLEKEFPITSTPFHKFLNDHHYVPKSEPTLTAHTSVWKTANGLDYTAMAAWSTFSPRDGVGYSYWSTGSGKPACPTGYKSG